MAANTGGGVDDAMGGDGAGTEGVAGAAMKRAPDDPHTPQAVRPPSAEAAGKAIGNMGGAAAAAAATGYSAYTEQANLHHRKRQIKTEITSTPGDIGQLDEENDAMRLLTETTRARWRRSPSRSWRSRGCSRTSCRGRSTSRPRSGRPTAKPPLSAGSSAARSRLAGAGARRVSAGNAGTTTVRADHERLLFRRGRAEEHSAAGVRGAERAPLSAMVATMGGPSKRNRAFGLYLRARNAGRASSGNQRIAGVVVNGVTISMRPGVTLVELLRQKKPTSVIMKVLVDNGYPNRIRIVPHKFQLIDAERNEMITQLAYDDETFSMLAEVKPELVGVLQTKLRDAWSAMYSAQARTAELRKLNDFNNFPWNMTVAGAKFPEFHDLTRKEFAHGKAEVPVQSVIPPMPFYQQQANLGAAGGMTAGASVAVMGSSTAPPWRTATMAGSAPLQFPPPVQNQPTMYGNNTGIFQQVYFEGVSGAAGVGGQASSHAHGPWQNWTQLG